MRKLMCLLVTLVAVSAAHALAAGVSYLYDDLGRLVRVVDETTGDVATYEYDAVGNILAITRGKVAELQPAITGINPSAVRAGQSTVVTLGGQNLLGGVVSTDNPGILVTDSHVSDTAIAATFVVSSAARLGPTMVTVKTGIGIVTVGLTVLPVLPHVTLSPRIVTLTPGTSTTVTAILSNADVFDTVVTLSVADPGVASVAASVTVPAGQISRAITVTGVSLGITTLTAQVEAGSTQTAVFVTVPFSGGVSVAASALSVRVPEVPGQLQEAIEAPAVSVQVPEPARSEQETIEAPAVSVRVPEVAGSERGTMAAALVSVQVPQAAGALTEPIVSAPVSVQVPQAVGTSTQLIFAPRVSAQVP